MAVTTSALSITSGENAVQNSHPIESLVDTLKTVIDIVPRLHTLYELQRLLTESAEAKEIFRTSGGFEVLRDVFTNLQPLSNTSNSEIQQEMVENSKCLFTVLACLMSSHDINQKYLSDKIGYGFIRSHISTSGLVQLQPKQLLGILLAFLIDDFSICSLFVSLSRNLDALQDEKPLHTDNEVDRFISNRLSEILSQERVTFPFIVPFIASVCEEISGSHEITTSSAGILSIINLVDASVANKVAISSSGIVGRILPFIWAKVPDRETEKPISARVVSHYNTLFHRLSDLGLDTPTAKDLFRQSMKSEQAAAILLSTIKNSREPPRIMFDLSMNGFSAVEFNSLGKTFPPPSPGYTFTSWIKIENLDPSAHLTLFGVYDKTQKCFTLVYLEQETCKLILQTSISSSRASVRFKNWEFKPGSWYHIAIAHRRSRVSSASKASLYINGKLVEVVKCPYPSNPPNEGHAQAFIGTPFDLSPRTGKNVIGHRWCLASLHLFEDIFSDDIIYVHHKLGPRYNGNFQDTLGIFQTYGASASLNLRNEQLHHGREDSSDIITSIRQRGSTIIPELKITWSVHAKNALNHSWHLDDANLQVTPKAVSALSKNHLLLLNSALPDIRIALSSINGIGIGIGDPLVIIPQSLDDASWRVGGSGLPLKMIEVAKTSEQLSTALSICFELLRESWRNSDDMERIHGFAITANLIKMKQIPGVIQMDTLNKILDFVGYDFSDPRNSMITNPLAYRILLVDYDIWRIASLDTLKAYFRQFALFGLESTYATFNSKRMNRMRIVKKFLQALKSGSFTKESLPYLMDAFKSIIKINVSADVMRSISLFVTYAFHDNGPKQQPGEPATELSFSNGVSKQEVGVLVLQAFTDVLCDSSSNAIVKKFARTVTNKWVLFLLSQESDQVVICGTKILARLLVIHGSSYVGKFSTKTGGFIIMKERLRSKWRIPEIWPIMLSILFGVDIATVDIQPNTLELFHLVETFRQSGKAAVVYPEMFSVISAMLKAGTLTVLNEEHKREYSGSADVENVDSSRAETSDDTIKQDPVIKSSVSGSDEGMFEQSFVKHLQVLIQFFTEMHGSCPSFQDFCSTPLFIQDVLSILFPAICSADPVGPEIELQSRDSALTFDGEPVVVRPASRAGNPSQVIKKIASVQPTSDSSGNERRGARPRATSLRRGSSFVLVTSDLSTLSTQPQTIPSTSNVPTPKQILPSAKKEIKDFKVTNIIVEGLLEMVVGVFADLVLNRRDFSELIISILIPPTFQEYQIYFETYLLRNTISHLHTTISFNTRILIEPRTLTNFGKFIQQMVESVFNGCFLGGAEPLLELIGMVIEYLQQPNVERLKSVRLCHTVIAHLRLAFMKLVLFKLSEMDEVDTDSNLVVKFLHKILYWQNVLLSPAFTEDHLIKLVCYLLYIKLVDKDESVRNAAANNWRMILVHKPVETSLILDQVKTSENRQLSSGFKKLQELDNASFLVWVDFNKSSLDDFFLGTVAQEWAAFVKNENGSSEENTKVRLNKRRERLRQTAMEENHTRVIFSEHKSSLKFWEGAIFTTEHLKFMRNLQDQQDNLSFLASEYAKLESDLTRPLGVIEDGRKRQWRLDLTEGRNRMRKRMTADNKGNLMRYLSKGEESLANMAIQSDVDDESSSTSFTEISNQIDRESETANFSEPLDNDTEINSSSNTVDVSAENEDGFEIVEDPRNQEADDDMYEDKNRKVLRSLEQGDDVVDLWNVCRIIGLDSIEGLLILGKYNLYLIDNFFQRADGEIVNLWEAPAQERDQYLQTIAGSDKSTGSKRVNSRQHDTRHWSFEDLVHVSRRQFLFRNVALELFFSDGRSFLITSISAKKRDQIHSKLVNKVSTEATAVFSENLWRQGFQPNMQGGLAGQLGSKLANVFAVGAANPVTRRWIKGEISNFYYLMLINTMAGRTFNDLTQYPVFPWVIADYTSDELDLSNPATFRDLSKPMGAQTSEREREFRERYQSFADLNDSSQPPFHYGTHFSSAMIVSSYLIRLEPFVQSYLLLQGGHFDHADRLFYSVERAWQSASRENMADVRELIPEFFYLPEFLVNSNDFKFGSLQGSGEEIGSVILPPWAKGDPKIFIQKNREALESPYVSQHLHEWVDLVFGFKQRGDAAIEFTNVYHHLSYHGAIDLDKIEDPMERIATIGIIHNFGQTPHQVFTRPHPQREVTVQKSILDLDADALIKMGSPIGEFRQNIDALIHPLRDEKAFSTPAYRMFIPPSFERMVEWGFGDDGVRFKSIETGKLIGHVEQIHQSNITVVKAVDSRTLVTAGYDSTVCVWKIQGTAKSVELQFKACLRGHTSPIISLAVSHSFSAIVSVSEDGRVVVWDLNRLRFVRELRHDNELGLIRSAAINEITGDILTANESFIHLWTINGESIISRDVSSELDDKILTTAFYEGHNDEWLENTYFFTGHKNNTVIVSSAFTLK
ncbi:uncharacterized protein V1510DRAFT_366256 [Dipodascopsis tothii]|uniref:uncharacterized protein n=1 Tax=Dipodascopsis tothii TaxID=44089 RepID=UPI0034CDF38E